MGSFIGSVEDVDNGMKLGCNHPMGPLELADMIGLDILLNVMNVMDKEIGAKYKIAPKRLASLVDIFACAFLALTPHDGGMLMITAMAEVSPIAVLKNSFYMFFLIIAACVTIQFGLLRTKEEK